MPPLALGQINFQQFNGVRVAKPFVELLAQRSIILVFRFTQFDQIVVQFSVEEGTDGVGSRPVVHTLCFPFELNVPDVGAHDPYHLGQIVAPLALN